MDYLTFSVLQGGASSIGEGEMVGAGINQLQYYDTFYNPDANSQGKGEFEESGQQMSADDSVIEKGDPGQNTGQTGKNPGFSPKYPLTAGGKAIIIWRL